MCVRSRPPSVIARFKHYRSDREIPRVTKTKGDAFDAHPFGTFASVAMECDFGRTAATARHFDRFPRDASDAGSERFHHRFFGGESARQLRCPVPRVTLFSGRIDFVEKPDRVPVAHRSDTVDFDEVDTRVYHDFWDANDLPKSLGIAFQMINQRRFTPKTASHDSTNHQRQRNSQQSPRGGC